MALQTYSINMGMGPSGRQGCTHKFIPLYCFCWVLGACIEQKKYYLSVFYYLPFSDSLSVLKGLELSLVYTSVPFLSAFIKSASSLRKQLVFHSACEVWPWSCLDPGTATDHLQLCMCCAAGSTRWLCMDVSVSCARAGKKSGCVVGTGQSLRIPFHFYPCTEDYIRKKASLWHRQRLT